MSDTQNYLRDMSRYMGDDHDPVASRPYTEMWEKYMNTGKNICIFAPRQSGKTYALRQSFINTPNSVFITMNSYTRRDTQEWCRSLGFTRGDLDYGRDIFTYQTAYRLRDRNVDRVFVDEIEQFRISLREFMFQIHPAGNITMATTPLGNYTHDEYRGYMPCVTLPWDYIENHSDTQPRVENYFEEGLFEI